MSFGVGVCHLLQSRCSAGSNASSCSDASETDQSASRQTTVTAEFPIVRAACHLANAGVDVSVTLGQSPSALVPVPSRQYDIIERMGVSVVDEPGRADVVIDALIGYSLRGAPRGRIGELVERIGDLGDRVVALDTPSGMDVTNGSVSGVAVTADLTMTLLSARCSSVQCRPVRTSTALVGRTILVSSLIRASRSDESYVVMTRLRRLYLADISIPPSVGADI
jgi:hypothetical protein